MNYYNCRFSPSSEHLKTPEREWNRPPTLSPRQTPLQGAFVRRPLFFQNHPRRFRPHFPKYKEYFQHKSFPEENIIRRPCFSYDWNFQLRNGPNFSRYCNRNRIPMGSPLSPYKQEFNCQYVQPENEFPLQSMPKTLAPQINNWSMRNTSQFDMSYQGVNHFETFNTFYDGPSGEIIQVPNLVPYDNSIPIHIAELQSTMPNSYVCNDISCKSLTGRENQSIAYQKQYSTSEIPNLLDISTDAQQSTFNNIPTNPKCIENADLSYSNIQIQEVEDDKASTEHENSLNSASCGIGSNTFEEINDILNFTAISDINTENIERNNTFEELENALNSTDENALAVYFLNNLYKPSDAENAILEIPPINQSTETENCNLNLTEKSNANDLDSHITDDVTNQILTEFESSVSANLSCPTEISNGKKMEKFLEESDRKEKADSQGEEKSKEKELNRRNIELSDSSSANNLDFSKQIEKNQENECLPTLASIFDKYGDDDSEKENPFFNTKSGTGHKLGREKEQGKYVFQAPVINIIQQNQISADNSTTCNNDSTKSLKGLKSDKFSENELYSELADSAMKFLYSLQKCSKTPYLGNFSAKMDTERNSNSSTGEDVIFENNSTTMDLTDPISKNTQPPTTNSSLSEIAIDKKYSNSSICETETEPSPENINDMRSVDVLSKSERSFTGTHELNMNSTHDEQLDFNSSCSKKLDENFNQDYNSSFDETRMLPSSENNGDIKLNSVKSIPKGEIPKKSDFIYSNILNSEILSNSIETSLSSVTNYVLDEPTNLDNRPPEESFERDEYISSPISCSNTLRKILKHSKKVQKTTKKRINCVQLKLLTSDNFYYSSNVSITSKELPDDILETDIDKYSSYFDDTLENNMKCFKREKRKRKQSRRENTNTPCTISAFTEEGKKLNTKINQNVRKSGNIKPVKLYHDALTQTVTLDQGPLVNHLAYKHDVQTQWNSSDLNFRTNGSKTTEKQYDLRSCKKCSKTYFDLKDKSNAIGANNKKWNFGARDSTSNVREVTNISTTASSGKTNYLITNTNNNSNANSGALSNNSINAKKVFNNSPKGTVEDDLTPDAEKAVENSTAVINETSQSSSNNPKRKMAVREVKRCIAGKNMSKAFRERSHSKTSYNLRLLSNRETRKPEQNATKITDCYVKQAENEKMVKDIKNDSNCKKTQNYQVKPSQKSVSVIQRENEQAPNSNITKELSNAVKSLNGQCLNVTVARNSRKRPRKSQRICS